MELSRAEKGISYLIELSMDSCLQTLLSYIPPLSPSAPLSLFVSACSRSENITDLTLSKMLKRHTGQSSRLVPDSFSRSVLHGTRKKGWKKGSEEGGREGRKEEGGKKGGREGRFFLLLLPQATYKPS